MPVVNVGAIGAGGGSILWVDAQGLLKVGPLSAGADPGPVAYGRGGTSPTITDCYLATGILDPARFLGGQMPLDRDASLRALDQVARQLGLSGAVEAAEAALRVASAKMATEIIKLLATAGADPREFALVAYGGAGPTHAVLLAEEARLDAVLVPMTPGAFCALGAVLADVRRDYVQTARHLVGGPGVLAVEADGWPHIAAAIERLQARSPRLGRARGRARGRASPLRIGEHALPGAGLRTGHSVAGLTRPLPLHGARPSTPSTSGSTASATPGAPYR